MGIVIFLGKKCVFLNSAAHKRCGAFILNPTLMNCVFAKNGALFENTIAGSDRELEWKDVPKSGSTNPCLERGISSLYLSAVVNMEHVLLFTSGLWGGWSISQLLSLRAGRAAECPLLEEEAEGSLNSPFLSGFRSGAAAPSCLAQAEPFSLPVSWKPLWTAAVLSLCSAGSDFGNFGGWVPRHSCSPGISWSPAQSCVCRWGRAELLQSCFQSCFPRITKR